MGFEARVGKKRRTARAVEGKRGAVPILGEGVYCFPHRGGECLAWNLYVETNNI